MVRYILKRLFQSLLTILLVVCIVFFLMRLMPTDYFFTEDELIKFTDQQKYAKLERMGVMSICKDCGGTGLAEDGTACPRCREYSTNPACGSGYVDRSMFAQLGDFFVNMFEVRVYNEKGNVIKTIDPVTVWTYLQDPHVFENNSKMKDSYHTALAFNLGKSIRLEKGQYVTDVIMNKMSVSMSIGLIALAVSLVLGVVLGVLQARYKDGLFDHIGTGYTVLVNAVPHLVIYTIIMIGGAALFKLPMRYDATANEPWKTMVLPIVCLSIGSTAGYMLWTRRYMVDELNKDYIRLAKLKGLSDRKVMFRHVLKNAFVPLAQYLPYSILLTVGGSLLVERFFSVPGMGPELTNAISRYDLNLVQGIVLLYATMGILGVFLGDLLMTLIDPRIKLVGKEGVR
ncbi:MAG: ABC transporter permease [Clostridia bacterium]|nr:ABC transporter permease [Clostridia bacterium]